MPKKRQKKDLIPDSEIELNDEIASVYEIDETDFIFDDASPELQEQINKKNEEFENEHILPYLIDLTRNAPCPCEMQARRLSRRWRQNKINRDKRGGVIGRISQMDFDSYHWGLLLKSRGGYDNELLLVMRRCNRCQRIECFGDESPLMYRAARLYMDQIDTPQDTSDYIVEDIATGETTSAGDLVRALQGVLSKGGTTNGKEQSTEAESDSAPESNG